MIDLSMKSLTSNDVDELHGLTLCVAYAIYVEGWTWFDFPNSDTPRLLLDAPLPVSVIVPDKDCARYVGGDFYVFEDLPRYDESLICMINKGAQLIKLGYSWDYSRYIETELQSSDHVRFLHASSEKRCRAILKFYLDNQNIKEEMEQEKAD